jgi:uncharacterized Tic20 family protein
VACGYAAGMDNRPPSTANPESRNWAMGAHLSALAGALLGGLPAFIGPLIVWLARRDDPFVEAHAKEALNFQIFTVLLGVAVVLIGVLTLGLGFLLALLLFLPALIVWLVFIVQGTSAAAAGRPYRYPISVRIIS